MPINSRTWTAAIAHDGAGRHYFVSDDGVRFRPVAYFPIAASQAEDLFRTGCGDVRYRTELDRAFGGRISFMSVID